MREDTIAALPLRTCGRRLGPATQEETAAYEENRVQERGAEHPKRCSLTTVTRRRRPREHDPLGSRPSETFLSESQGIYLENTIW